MRVSLSRRIRIRIYACVMRLKDSDGSHEQLISWTKNVCQVTARYLCRLPCIFLISFH